MFNINENDYDSKANTLLHIKRVSQLIFQAVEELLSRADMHDNSKLKSPEKEVFDKVTPRLKMLTYGSVEYQESLKEIEVALKHHYKHNSHHPEYYENGVDGMNLFDVMEMFMDWKAAGERHADGNIYKSIVFNTKRFNLSEQLVNTLINTAKYLDW